MYVCGRFTGRGGEAKFTSSVMWRKVVLVRNSHLRMESIG